MTAGVRLLGAGDIRGIAGRLGVRPTKRLGQNFVVEQGTVRRIAALAAPRDGDVVLEVGPGLGSLTLALLEASAGSDARLVAVEIDAALAAELPRTVADRAPGVAGQLLVVQADALHVVGPGAARDHTDDRAIGSGQASGHADGRAAGRRRERGTGVELPWAPTVLAANLPYNVAVPVVLHLLAALPSLERGVVMVQAEVADRMCAGPGSRVYGGPSAKLAWFAAVRPAGVVPRSVFWPVPNVDSKLVAFTRRDPPATSASRQEVFAVIDAAFGQRRKTLRAALAGWAGSPAEAERLLRAACVDPRARGESLGIAEFARVAAASRLP
ncbi:MAG: rRNA adenine dimethyltransferase family protein [Trebonia sp.]|uniref:ribosomal RNA small subunit methyltransferase A n=3 Tax=Trebonia sp. TaxID=2767075 RepID=UPI003C7764B2